MNNQLARVMKFVNGNDQIEVTILREVDTEDVSIVFYDKETRQYIKMLIPELFFKEEEDEDVSK